MTKAFIITLLGLERSLTAAETAKSSAEEHGLSADFFEAVTRNEAMDRLEQLGLETRFQDDTHGDFLATIGCLLSHYLLWQKCIERDKGIVVLEHDAFILGNIPLELLRGHACVNLGKPSYGRIKKPKRLDYYLLKLVPFLKKSSHQIYPLFSRKHLPGTHAYYVEPAGARKLIAHAQTNGILTPDHFMSLKDFPFLEEIQPWCAEARPNFSTIQHEKGIHTTHGFKEASAKNESYLTAKDFWDEKT